MPIRTASMHLRRTVIRLCAVLIGVLAPLVAGVPMAAAFTAPTLVSPSGGADFTEGRAISFDWSGSLQGDAGPPTNTLDRSYFRVELARTDDVPAGGSSSCTTPASCVEWTELENFVTTDSGASTTSESLGAPAAAGYSWRVCAIGVADAEDPSANNTLEALACSSARTLTTVEASGTSGTPGTVTVTNNHTVDGADNVVTETRTTTLPGDPAPNKTVTLPDDDPRVAGFDSDQIDAVFGDGASSSVNLGEEGLDVNGESSGGGALSGLARGLGATIPGVPIPFWSLGLLLLSLPGAWLWRRSTLAMFDWPDGVQPTSVDLASGLGGVKPDDDPADVALTPDADSPPDRLVA